MADDEKVTAKKNDAVFSKTQILTSKRYQDRQDLLAVALEDNAHYSHADLEKIIDGFMKGKVK